MKEFIDPWSDEAFFNNSYRCQFGNDPKTCQCSPCVMERRWNDALAATEASVARNFGAGGIVFHSAPVSPSPIKPEPEVKPIEKTANQRLDEQKTRNIKENEKAFEQTEASKAQPAEIKKEPPQVILDPKNAFWPPYNFVAEDSKKEIKVRYEKSITKFAVLSPEEWKAFFDSFDAARTIKDTVTGLYDAPKTAKALGGLGVTAFVKNIDGVDYLILKNYDVWKQNILYGGVFRADNAKVVRLGLGALDSVKGMTTYVKVTAPMEILVGSAINVLQFVVNDQYTLEQLGVDQGKLFVHALAVAGLALGTGFVLSGVAATVTGQLIILAVSNATVWVVDQWTDFEAKLVEKAIEVWE